MCGEAVIYLGNTYTICTEGMTGGLVIQSISNFLSSSHQQHWFWHHIIIKVY